MSRRHCSLSSLLNETGEAVDLKLHVLSTSHLFMLRFIFTINYLSKSDKFSNLFYRNPGSDVAPISHVCQSSMCL